jgi:hypothetical protein
VHSLKTLHPNHVFEQPGVQINPVKRQQCILFYRSATFFDQTWPSSGWLQNICKLLRSESQYICLSIPVTRLMMAMFGQNMELIYKINYIFLFCLDLFVVLTDSTLTAAILSTSGSVFPVRTIKYVLTLSLAWEQELIQTPPKKCFINLLIFTTFYHHLPGSNEPSLWCGSCNIFRILHNHISLLVFISSLTQVQQFLSRFGSKMVTTCT